MANELTERLDRIAHRLSPLRDEHRRKIPWWSSREKRSVFGAEQHEFVLRDPLLESEVIEFEEKCRVELPSDYRAFLGHLGDGGAGPYFGLASLGVHTSTAHVVDTEVDARWIGRACPLRDDLPAENPDWLVAMGGDEWESRIRGGDWHPYQGSITLCEVGCAYFFVLILTGHCKGRICGVHDMYDDPPIFPRYASFLDWYETWLDAVEQDDSSIFYSNTNDRIGSRNSRNRPEHLE